MKNQPVTMKDIARELGITVATVSRALKNYPDISPTTKKAVLSLAQKLNYRPNPIALSLRKRKSNILGLIVPEIVHHFFSTVVSGIVETAEVAGYSVMICQSNESYKREVREAQALLDSRVDGLLISMANTTKNIEHIQEYIQYGIPVVLFDRVNDDLDVTRVVVDDYKGGFEAVEHLLEQGCRKVGLIRGPLSVSVFNLRYQGYRDALAKYQIPFNPDFVRESTSFDLKECSQITQEMMESANRPDSIFAMADSAAIGALAALKSLKYRVPEDISVVGFSNWQMASVTDPPLTTVAQPGYEMGQTATELLLHNIEAKEKEEPQNQEQVCLKTRLIVRESSRKIMGILTPPHGNGHQI